MASISLLLISKIAIILLLGLVLGSFATAIVYRIPRNLPWAFGRSNSVPRSKCTKCETVLQPLDLIPVFSWLFNKGCCRHCAARVSALYPLTECITAMLCVALFIASGFVFEVPVFFMLFAAPLLVALAVIDLQHKLLPKQLVALLAVLGVLYQGARLFVSEYNPRLLQSEIFEYVGGGIIYGLIAWALGASMKKVLGKEALGMGDVKFFAVSGLWLGLSNFPLFCIFAGFFGVVLAFVWKKIRGEAVFPFGPALIASFCIVLLLGSSHFI